LECLSAEVAKYAEQFPDPTLCGVEMAWQGYKKCWIRAAHTILHLDQKSRQPWISDATWGLIQGKKKAFADLMACIEPGKQANLKHRLRQVLNACGKAVKHDKKKYWQRLADDLHRDVAQGNIHSAYKRMGLRDVLDRVELLHGRRLKQPDGSFTIWPREMSRIWRQHFHNLLNCERAVQPEALILMEEQCGFREGRGCNDAIYCLKRVFEMAKRKQVNMHACMFR
jgi:hypothetical protein